MYKKVSSVVKPNYQPLVFKKESKLLPIVPEAIDTKQLDENSEVDINESYNWIKISIP